MKYTQIPTDTFQTLQMNAGILATGFDPETGVVTGLLGATTGGIQFADAISFIDLGEDIDNCPKNMKELKILDQREITMSGTFVTVKAATAKLMSIADVSGNKITPRNDVIAADFSTIWFIGDYSDVNTGDNAGFLAIKLINALSTGGFSMQTTDKEKGQFAFTFTGHYSMANQTKVPYEIYIKSTGSLTPSITLSPDVLTIEDGDDANITAVVVPAGAVVTYTSSNTSVATVTSAGVVTGEGEGNCTITGTITVDGVSYADTMTVVVTAATT